MSQDGTKHHLDQRKKKRKEEERSKKQKIKTKKQRTTTIRYNLDYLFLLIKGKYWSLIRS